MIEMGVDIVYPVELPSQASLTIEGQNCFEPVVCKLSSMNHGSIR
jgi:amidase